MQMFSATLTCCPKTGIATYEIKFDIGTGVKTDRGSFLSKASADHHIYKSKRDYILTMFENYVNHSKILHEVGTCAFYRTPLKLESLDRCREYNQWFQDKKLHQICQMILKLRDDLEKILPSPSNNSYDSSRSKLLDMVVFCKAELQVLDSPTLFTIHQQPD